jgi:hypothetical protein
MHKTLIPEIKGHIDFHNDLEIAGWFLHSDRLILRFILDDSSIHVEYTVEPRQDVIAFYKKGNVDCGFRVQLPQFSFCRIGALLNGEWKEIYQISDSNKIFKTSNEWKTAIVIDNFYDDPDLVRKFALNQKFNLHPEYHKGQRTDALFRPDFIKDQFEKLIGKKIPNWPRYGTNGCFQYCTAEEKIVYHCDSQNYAGVVYLTPDAPPESGTTLYRSKVDKSMKVDRKDYPKIFANGFYDSTQFDVVDVIGNVYNRLILWDANIIHAASTYFGTNLHNSRLFHLFFFDVER